MLCFATFTILYFCYIHHTVFLRLMQKEEGSKEVDPYELHLRAGGRTWLATVGTIVALYVLLSGSVIQF